MRKLIRSESGNVMVEFALSWALLSIIFTSVFQFGYTIWVYNCLENSVQNAAKYGASMTYSAGSPSTMTTAIQNMVVYASPAGGTSPIVPGLTTANVTVDTHNVSGFPTNVTVAIQNYTINALFGSKTFNKPRVTVQFLGDVRP